MKKDEVIIDDIDLSEALCEMNKDARHFLLAAHEKSMVRAEDTLKAEGVEL